MSYVAVPDILRVENLSMILQSALHIQGYTSKDSTNCGYTQQWI